ncbi:MAG: amidase [Actinomycetota bacterium]|nr:amidase [Actinomycetota bacterium]
MELHDLTALEQAAAIRRREVGPVELVKHYLERIDRYGAQVGAFVTVTADAARTAAAEAQAAITRGQAGLPPLHGVPTAIKDLNLTAGVRTTFGSAAFAEFVPTVDDFVVERLRGAGTISLGKTNTPEFGLPCYTEPDVAPPARTPWDLDRSAGGSSGGAGAAVAAGLVPFAQGSDGGGSVRIPASACGLFGIKVSRGRISNGPLRGDVNGLGWMGPLARTVRDAAAMLDAMAGPMPGDPHWAPLPAEPFSAYAGRDPGRLRIGRYRTPVITDAEVHPDCVAAYDAASDLLTSLGHVVEDVDPPFTAALTPMFETLWWVGAASVPLTPAQEALVRPLTRHLREQGRGVSGVDYTGAVAALQAAARMSITATAAYDAVLTPTLAQPPALLGSLRNDADPAADFTAQTRFTPFTAPYNMTGQPAVSLPLHWTGDGLPIGVMLVGRPADEATLLSLSAQLEAARPWAHRQPPMW